MGNGDQAGGPSWEPPPPPPPPPPVYPAPVGPPPYPYPAYWQPQYSSPWPYPTGPAGRPRVGVILAAVVACLIALATAGMVLALLPATRQSLVFPPYVSSGVRERAPVALAAGGNTQTLHWPSQSGSFYIGTAVPGGVQVELPTSGQAIDYAPSNAYQDQGLRVEGDVRFENGDTGGNGLGLGCIGPNFVPAYWFFVHSGGNWSFDLYPPRSAVVLLARGLTSAIHDTSGVNHLAVTCVDGTGGTSFELAVNGDPVANIVVPGATADWYPIVASCSPSGPDTAVFTDVTESVIG